MKSNHPDISTRLRAPEDDHAESVVFAADNGGVRLRNLQWPPATHEAVSMCIVAELGGKVVGRAMLEAVYPPFAEIQNVHVLEHHRGRGAGGAVLDECVARAAERGFMALFLQTGAENVAARRLYARKGFLLAGCAQMLRLVRFVNLPVLDAFLHAHPLATYSSSEGGAEGEWHLTWADRPSGDRLRLTVTGGTCQGDSNGLGPGLCAVSLRSDGTELSARLGVNDEAGRTGTVTLEFAMDNTGAPVRLRTRLLLPPGCVAQGGWAESGPMKELAPGETLRASAEVALTDDLDVEVLRYAAFRSIPLTVEAFVDDSSFWLTRAIRPDKGGRPDEREPHKHV